MFRLPIPAGMVGAFATSFRDRPLSGAPSSSPADAGAAHALSLHLAGRLGEAAMAYRALLAANPYDAGILRLLSTATGQMGDPRSALAIVAKAIALDPGDGEGHRYRAHALGALGHPDAGNAHRRAAHAAPLSSDAANDLGSWLARQGDPKRATRWLRRAVAIEPNFSGALGNLGSALHETAAVRDALAFHTRALAVDPGNGLARNNRALALLLAGDWKRGWPEHEHVLGAQGGYPHRLSTPRWRGEPFPGRVLLIHDEIGYGDVFNFLRYVPLAKRGGGEVWLETRPGLQRLLAGYAGIDRVLERSSRPPPGHDLHVSIESLPGIFGSTPDAVPPPLPALLPPAGLAADWQARLGPRQAFRVGVVWAGNPDNAYDRQRSCALSDLSPLLDRPDLDIYALQKGANPAELASWTGRGLKADLGAHLTDFADTAAAISCLDAVVGVETAVTHLAGAMEKPTFLLLSNPPSWRWLLGRDDTPWYPTMRLYRQTSPGDWSEPIRRLTGDIAKPR